MIRSRPFDLLNSPLEGTNLIEASAGTGKTYTIAGLFLRLLLEQGLAVEHILVVTFTEAATQELRDRIRTRLREAAAAFAEGKSKDPFLSGLLEQSPGREASLRILRQALRCFDQAAIFTIHGFCRRVLQENAFESGSLFDTELKADLEYLRTEVAEDYWRIHFYRASPLLVHYALGRKFGPGHLLSLLANHAGQPYLKIIPQRKIPDTTAREGAFKAALGQVRKTWNPQEVVDILQGEGLKRNMYPKARIALWVRNMEAFLAFESPFTRLFEGFEKFTLKEIRRALKKGAAMPEHPFFSACQALQECREALEEQFEIHLKALEAAFIPWARETLARRKAQRNIQSFDDLLLRLDGALRGKGGKGLARAVRRRFRAALIDEFQDTDPVQYAIFRTIFQFGENILFLIGDPKQAIYSFRGADIFAYMEAAEGVRTRYSLEENYRAEKGLITATNALFSKAPHPFVYERIPFLPARAPDDRAPEVLRIHGKPRSPFVFWYLDPDKVGTEGKAIDKGPARQAICRAVAADISRLLKLAGEGRAHIGERPLHRGDIAVLVRKNMEARLMQEALAVLRIPSVLYSTADLFETREAMEVEQVLAAVRDPRNTRLLRSALATDMLGLKGEDLEALMSHDEAWEQWLVRFRKYHEQLRDRGFIRMFRSLLSEQGVLPRLMALPDGERRNTNVLHLGEVLHKADMEHDLGLQGLLKWLAEQRRGERPRLEEHQLRLESDANAVNLVTVHRSKGLEYPVVYCPFAWDGSRISQKGAPFTFHDEEDGMRLTLDLGSGAVERNREKAEKELLSENLRLLYVAVTRARSQCTLIWGRFKGAETSAPAYLFYASGAEGDAVGKSRNRVLELDNQALRSEVKALAESAKGAMEFTDVPPGAGDTVDRGSSGGAALSCRHFTGTIDASWGISSFSSLVAGRHLSAETPDRDEVAPEGEAPEGEAISGIFSFPKGTGAGLFLHDLFEHLDFQQREATAVEGLVQEKLRIHGFDTEWLGTITELVHNTLSISLDPEFKDLRLSRIPMQDRINEMEFYFPLKKIQPQSLIKLFKNNGYHSDIIEEYTEFESLRFNPVHGFMKGFVDMVFRYQDRFFLVDWKSNFLGARVEDYDQASLRRAMAEAHYVLQYHIYTLALHHYLQVRIPGYDYEQHFGGVFYIFLRGVDKDMGPDYGVFRDRPSLGMIQALTEGLMG